MASSSVLLSTTLTLPKPLLRHHHPFSSLSLLSPSPISLSSSSSIRPLILHHVPPIHMGGGPRTFPGGVTKWQWKRMQAKKSKQLLKARLLRERQIYETRKRAELNTAVSNLEKPWELVQKAPALFSVAADDQLKALADRFQRPGGFDMWTDRDGPQVFRRPDGDDLLTSRFFPKGVVHSVKPYGNMQQEEEGVDDWIARGAGGVRRRLKRRAREGTEGVRGNADEGKDGDLGCIDVEARLLDGWGSENAGLGITEREDDGVKGERGLGSEGRQRGRGLWTRNAGLHSDDGSGNEDLSLESLSITNREWNGVKGRRGVRGNSSEGRQRGSASWSRNAGLQFGDESGNGDSRLENPRSWKKEGNGVNGSRRGVWGNSSEVRRQREGDSWSRNVGLQFDDKSGNGDSGLENPRSWKKEGNGVNGSKLGVRGNFSEGKQRGSGSWSRNTEMHSNGGSGNGASRLDHSRGWKKEGEGVNGGGRGIQGKSFEGRRRGNDHWSNVDKGRLRPTSKLHADGRRTGA